MILSYRSTYNNDNNFKVPDYDEDLHKAAYCIIKLSIILMCDFIA